MSPSKDSPPPEANREIIEMLPGDLRRIAEVAGAEAAVRLARAFRGTFLYVPGLDEIIRRARDASIRRDYAQGESARGLSRRHRLSERQIRNILKTSDGETLPEALLRLVEKTD